jgi:hypothetical protein
VADRVTERILNGTSNQLGVADDDVRMNELKIELRAGHIEKLIHQIVEAK